MYMEDRLTEEVRGRDMVSGLPRTVTVNSDDITDAISKKLEVDAKQAEDLKRHPGDQSEKVLEAATSVFDDLCHEINLNYVSCSPFRVPIARVAAAQAALKEKGASASRKGEA